MADVLGLLRAQPQAGRLLRSIEHVGRIGEHGRALHRLGEPVVLGGGDHPTGHHAQGGALGVVAAEHFLVVVVGDVGDAAAEGERLLHLRGLTQPTDVGWRRRPRRPLRPASH